jgi:hypothetical protein
VRLEELVKLKRNQLIGTRTRDLPAFSTVPLPTTLPRAPEKYKKLRIYGCTNIISRYTVNKQRGGTQVIYFQNTRVIFLADYLGILSEDGWTILKMGFREIGCENVD